MYYIPELMPELGFCDLFKSWGMWGFYANANAAMMLGFREEVFYKE